MSNREIYYIPKQLDAPARWLLWTLDEAFSFFIPTFTCFSLGHPLWGAGLGIGCFVGWKKLKGTGSLNMALFALYWFFPRSFTRYLTKFKTAPASHNRFYTG